MGSYKDMHGNVMIFQQYILSGFRSLEGEPLSIAT